MDHRVDRRALIPSLNISHRSKPSVTIDGNYDLGDLSDGSLSDFVTPRSPDNERSHNVGGYHDRSPRSPAWGRDGTGLLVLGRDHDRDGSEYGGFSPHDHLYNNTSRPAVSIRAKLFFAVLFPVLAVIILSPLALFILFLAQPDELVSVKSNHIVTGVFAAYCCVFVPTGVLFILRMRRQPIRARSPLLLAISAVCGLINVSYISVAITTGHRNPVPCGLAHVVLNLTYPAFVLPYYIRTYRLWYCFNMNAETFSDESSFSDEGFRGTQRYAMKLFVLCLLPFSVFIAVYFGSDINLLPLCNFSSVEFFGVVWIIVHSLELFGFLWCVNLLKNVWDAYSIKDEIIICSITTCLFAFTLIGFQFANLKKDVETEIGLLMMTRVFAFFLISVVWPLFRTFFPARSAFLDAPSKESLSSLLGILQDPMLFPYFRDFTVQQLTAAQLKFWMEVELFREDHGGGEIPADPARIETDAQTLVNTYLTRSSVSQDPSASPMERSPGLSPSVGSPGSHHGVASSTTRCVRRNIAPRILEDIFRACERGAFHACMFDQAQAEIFAILENVSFPMFLQSELCAELVASMEDREKVMGRLVNSHVL